MTPPLLYVGAPMWAHKEWRGRIFPADVSANQSLEAYATWCTAVEGNTTFYATPSAESVRRWRDQTPETFRFCFKLPRTITHEHRLRNSSELVLAFLETIQPLGPRVGPVQIQLPASFSDADFGVLVQFLDSLPTSVDWALEVRHSAFFAGGAAERPLNDVLAERGINRVILDSRPLFSGPAETPAEIEAFASKPRLPVRPVATARHPIVRLIGLTDEAATEAAWAQWLPKLVDWLDAGLVPFVFVHTPDNAASPVLNRRLHAAVRALRPQLLPLPEPRCAEEQLGLWDGGHNA
ncbi:MAG: DUF72 domain-containing protein [Acidimicrobiales bacterium]